MFFFIQDRHFPRYLKDSYLPICISGDIDRLIGTVNDRCVTNQVLSKKTIILNSCKLNRRVFTVIIAIFLSDVYLHLLKKIKWKVQAFRCCFIVLDRADFEKVFVPDFLLSGVLLLSLISGRYYEICCYNSIYQTS
jgi:hypothetical protein